MKKGKEIEELSHSNEISDLQRALKILEDSRKTFRKRKFKRYAIIIGFTALGSLTGYGLVRLINAFKTLYDRKAYDEKVFSMFGATPITEALTDEFLILAYSYDNNEPRFYSKYAFYED